MTAAVRRVWIYPIKSLGPVEVASAKTLASGALEHDREFALVDANGKWVNGKRDGRIHRIRAEFNLPSEQVTLRESAGQAESFHLRHDRGKLETWFSDFFGFPTRIERNTEMGFPDDTDSPGPTIVSGASLEAVAAWFGLPPEETGRRFRPNIELETEEPFWEDRLYSASQQPVNFSIGSVAFEGVNPCQRCAVPSRNPETGAVLENFQRAFAAHRAATLPPWAPVSRFDHYYRLSVNTRIPASQAGRSIRVGDMVALREPS